MIPSIEIKTNGLSNVEGRLYKEFRGGDGEEIHLVAMVCKRADVVRGKVESGAGVPLLEG